MFDVYSSHEWKRISWIYDHWSRGKKLHHTLIYPGDHPTRPRPLFFEIPFLFGDTMAHPTPKPGSREGHHFLDSRFRFLKGNLFILFIKADIQDNRGQTTSRTSGKCPEEMPHVRRKACQQTQAPAYYTWIPKSFRQLKTVSQQLSRWREAWGTWRRERL